MQLDKQLLHDAKDAVVHPNNSKASIIESKQQLNTIIIIIVLMPVLTSYSGIAEYKKEENLFDSYL